MPRRRNRNRSSPTSISSTLTTTSAPSQRVTAFDFTTRLSDGEIDPRLLTSITDKLRAADLLSKPTKRVFRLRKASAPRSTKAAEVKTGLVQETDLETLESSPSSGSKKKTRVWVPLIPTVQPSRTLPADLSYAKAATMSDKSTSDGERSASGGSEGSAGSRTGSKKMLFSQVGSQGGTKLDDGFTVVSRKKR